MRTESAIQLINSMVYKPGWIIEATDHTKRFEGAVCVKISYPARNSDRDNALRNYADSVEPIARASFTILVDKCDEIELCRKILHLINVIDVHEAREFLRVKPTMWAPFHPHRADGMERWGDVQGDLTFGLS